jgi:hypothetical protein
MAITRLGPHFIGIGAARAGTTWVSEHLQRHPRIWIPRRKELHYFTRGLEYASPSYLADDHPLRRFLSLAPHNRVYRRNLIKALGYNLVHPSATQLAWDVNYYLRRIDDRWYHRLFPTRAGLITGEITPAYSLLTEPDATRLVQQLPDVKIIHLLRHPSDRAWSTIRYHEKRYGQKLTTGSPDAINAYLSNPAIVLRSNYPHVLALWRRLLPAEQIFVAFYDEIVESPRELLSRLFTFLGVSTADFPVDDATLRAQVNPSFEKGMPPGVREALARQYLGEVELLSQMVGGYANRWLADLRDTLAKPART